MPNAPHVSVVIAAWNKERYLDDALQSVFSQTRAPFEIIVVNDGSTDGTRQVVQRYSDRVRLIDQENAGAARARNVGIRSAVGTHIAFLDADDAWKPHKLASQLDVLERYPEVALISSRAEMTDEHGTLLGRLTDTGRGAVYDRPRDWHRDLLMKGNNLMTSSIIASRAALLEVGGFFDERRIVSHDYELWIRLSEGRTLWVSSEPLVLYRMLQTSLLHGTTQKEYGAQLGIISMHRHRYSDDEWRRRLARLYCDWADSAEYEGETGAPARLLEAARQNLFNPGLWTLAGRIASRRIRKRLSPIAIMRGVF